MQALKFQRLPWLECRVTRFKVFKINGKNRRTNAAESVKNGTSGQDCTCSWRAKRMNHTPCHRCALVLGAWLVFLDS